MSEFLYTPETAILYSCGIGESENLDYLYECNENFKIFPTFLVLPGIKALIDFDVHQKELSQRKIPFDLTRLLHGEQFIEFYKPLVSSTSGKFITQKPHIVEVLDKGNATLVVTENNTYTVDKQIICRNQVCCVIGGTGGWGGKRQGENVENIVKPPEGREPDKIVSQLTALNQAALYRLSGDRNPLHIDPMFAQAAGFKKPILHGLCTFGFAVRHILNSFPNNDIKRIKVRFSGVLYPGETIVTEMWKEDKRIHFQCKALESNKNLIVGAYVDFF